MATYANGQIPANLLIEIGPYHYLTAGTKAKWEKLVALGKKHGVTLTISPGKNAYRDYEGQVHARKLAEAEGRPNDAAIPGTSSHGGELNGRDSLAIDVWNWAQLGQERFYAIVREAGFEPGYFDWEPWHIIDWEPYRSITPPPAPKPTIPKAEEDEMLQLILDGRHYIAVGPGILHHYVGGDPFEAVKNIERSADDWQHVSWTVFAAILKENGCDKNIRDNPKGTFAVQNPLDGTTKPGNTWTAWNAVRAELRNIRK